DLGLEVVCQQRDVDRAALAAPVLLNHSEEIRETRLRLQRGPDPHHRDEVKPRRISATAFVLPTPAFQPQPRWRIKERMGRLTSLWLVSGAWPWAGISTASSRPWAARMRASVSGDRISELAPRSASTGTSARPPNRGHSSGNFVSRSSISSVLSSAGS